MGTSNQVSAIVVGFLVSMGVFAAVPVGDKRDEVPTIEDLYEQVQQLSGDVESVQRSIIATDNLEVTE